MKTTHDSFVWKIRIKIQPSLYYTNASHISAETSFLFEAHFDRKRHEDAAMLAEALLGVDAVQAVAKVMKPKKEKKGEKGIEEEGIRVF